MAQSPSQANEPPHRDGGGGVKAFWDKRRGQRDERRPADRARRQLAIGWLVITVVAGAVCLLNVLGFTQGGRGRVVEHLVFEGSSWLAITLLAWTPWAVLRATGTWFLPMRLGAHALAALLFSGVHVGLFILFLVGVLLVTEGAHLAHLKLSTTRSKPCRSLPSTSSSSYWWSLTSSQYATSAASGRSARLKFWVEAPKKRRKRALKPICSNCWAAPA